MLVMKIYSYLIDHDFGLAPNPFGQYCTFAVCKPNIRKSKNLRIGDWIIGTGSRSLERSSSIESVSKLIFAMKVSEIIKLDEYFLDPRFEYKKPNMNGTLMTRFGDNFYYLSESNEMKQLDCAHRNSDGIYNAEHIRKDIGGKNALISDLFYYFGQNAPQIPVPFKEVCHTTQGVKIVRPDDLANNFIEWLQTNFQTGLRGLPISWTKYEK